MRDVEVLQIRNTDKRCGMFHERFAISVARTGTGTVRYRGHTAEHDTGTMFFLEPGEVHSSPAAVGPLGWDVIFIDGPLLHRAADRSGRCGDVHWRSIVARDREAIGLFTRALSALHNHEEPEAAQVALDDFLDVVMRRHAEGSGTSTVPVRDTALVRKLRTRLRDLSHERMSLAELAAAYGTSVYHMIRCFRAEVGVPPHQYVLQLRVERARKMLARGLKPTQVAYELGFSDQSHLNRHFTRLMGVTPGQYAQAIR